MPKVRRCRQYGCHAMCLLPKHYCPKHVEHEKEYLATRAKWQNLGHNKAKAHQYNTVVRNRSSDKREQYNFYRTRQWAYLRQRVLDRDNYLCQYCRVIGKLIPDSKTVDHIIPVEVKPSDKANECNLAVICRPCHYKKTEWERKYYGTGNGNELKDVEPIEDVKRIVLMMNGGNNHASSEVYC
ncbi:HNH endonuclease [Pediococcus pentosaceus]|uniref:HNH endonuclease n=1 Tax=Pediococcus pentosaceus TaxID=1255 RepID=UPI0021A4F0BC|nr:HNH endonuclease [Pediococcus pentosaceus]MCT3020869.1 HNH endonuclease [Pediococcus pentosaceus]